jgi:isoleucyl-tRNA synthetase
MNLLDNDNENEIMNQWKTNNIYQQIMNKKTNNKFNFMDGPPFVSSNSLHFGHLMIGFLKSAVLNYKQMNGMNCLNELGYDCHGLPIEMVANKQLNVYTKKDVEEYGIDKYNSFCKEMINKYAGAWTPIYERIGRFANFNKTYKTMDTNFMESVWWVFGELYKKNLIYKGKRVLPYSNACNSPLSNFEASQNYKDIETKSVYVLFKMRDSLNTFIVAWTTTPWTLPSNVALCVNHEGIYDYIEFNDKNYICAHNLVKNLGFSNFKFVESCTGKELAGQVYEPIFNYLENREYKIIVDYEKNFVDLTTIGTGTDFSGKLCTAKETNDEIIKNIKQRGLLLKTFMMNHTYPYCYRTDTPLIYKATSSWFVQVTELKEKLLLNNEKINWHPSSIGSGRFKAWLENVKDWGISRNRFFGTPIPIWTSDEETICVSSIEELEKLCNTKITDLHPEYIFSLEIPSPTGKGVLRNVKLVLDCWFESGCVPLAQLHYPFENKNIFDNRDYLTDFIAEGLDQTRGWFYTLHVISTALFNKPAFKDVICTGLILDENGQKFSKKYGNFKDPMEVLNKYGADMTRLYLLSSPVINAEPLFFNELAIEKIKQRIIPYINAVKLFITHNKDFTSKGYTLNKKLWEETTNIMDLWIISTTHNLVININKYMDDYKVDKVIMLLIEYIEDLTNWYIKLNRDRIRGLSTIEERNTALSVLYKVLNTYVKCATPFMPFLSESIYSLFHDTSVHLCDYPKGLYYNEESINKFNIFKDVVRNIRNIRNGLTNSAKIPIYKVIIYHNSLEFINIVKTFEDIIKEETNCLKDNLEYKIIPNMKTLGKKCRNNINTIKEKLMSTSISYKQELVIDGYNITIDDYEIEMIPKLVSISQNMVSKIENELMVSVDPTYTEELHNMYQIRKLVSAVQNLRKKLGLNPWNKITVNIDDILLSNYIDELKSRLLCDVVINQVNNIYTEFEYENYDNTTKIIKIWILII